jgi:hypothetical protein
LPKNLKPYLYEIQLQPFIGPYEEYGSKSFSFDGKTTIHFTCLFATDKIIFHAVKLEINDYILTSSDDTQNNSILAGNIEYDTIREFAIINLNENCTDQANYSLTLNYSGIISENLIGFYRSSYVDKFNKTF